MSMADFEIKLTGLEGVLKNLEQLKPKQMDAVVRKGVRAANTVFQAAVMEAAPEAATDPTGNSLPKGFLREDIGVRTRTELDGSISGIVGPGKMSAHVAWWVSMGHRIFTRSGKGQKPTDTGKRSESNPFVSRAFDQAEPDALAAFETTVTKSLEKIGLAR